MIYRHATIHVASGTGNSLSVARSLAAGLAGGAQVQQLVEGRALVPPAEGGEELFALVYPTHGFTAPWAVYRHACLLPRRKGTHALIIPTRAAMKLGALITPGVEGSGPLVLAAILWSKGYRVRGWQGIDMPSNWLAVHWGMRQDHAEAVGERAQRQVRAICARLEEGRPVFGMGSALQLVAGLLLVPVSLGYLLLGRLLLAKLFVASSRCNGCRRCAERCPHAAIRWWGGRPYWSFSCASCMRCMAYCPQRAVEAGQALVLPYYLLTVPLFWWLMASVATGIPAVAAILERQPIALALQAAFSLCAVGLAYAALTPLLRIPLVNALVTWTTLTRFWRRSHAPGIAAEDLAAPIPAKDRGPASVEG